MVVCSDPETALRLRRLREYGWAERHVSAETGVNSRLDEIQAAILRVKLTRLSQHNERRRTIASAYRAGLRIGGLPVERKGVDHVYHLFVLRVEDRESLRVSLREEGIGTAVHYPVPVHQQGAYSSCLTSLRSRLVATEGICGSILSVPLHPQLEQRDVDRVCECLNRLATAKEILP